MLSLASPTDPFLASMADAVRTIRRSHRGGLSVSDQRLLDDIARGRYVQGIRRSVEISRGCADPADATAIAEAIRGFTLAGHPALELTVFDAMRAETHSNGPADMAQLEYVLAPSRGTAERAIDALRAQELATRAAIDALHKDAASRRITLVRA
jgi:hypothetical protein